MYQLTTINYILNIRMNEIQIDITAPVMRHSFVAGVEQPFYHPSHQPYP